MPSTTPTTMTIAELRLSPFNCRTNVEDQQQVDAIAASILVRGLIHPLQVHPMLGSKKYGVFAGGRRYRAHKKLIDAGQLPADHAIAVIVHQVSDVELIELSLAENLLRRDLRPYEEYAAVRRAQASGHTPQQIADALGQPLIWVRRALRLADLPKPIFDALSRGAITDGQAKIFAATEDREAQLAAWKQLAGGSEALRPDLKDAEIRRALRLEDGELDRLLLLVGEQAYVAAGGGWELDLFTGDEGVRGKLQDEGLLRRLADAKLDAYRTELRRRVGREVRFQTRPPAHPEYAGSNDHALQIHVSAVTSEIALPEGDVVGVIVVDTQGKPQVSWWWASRKAKHGATKKPASARTAPPSTTTPAGQGRAIREAHVAQAADAQIKEQLGGTRDAVQIFRSMRRQILRAMMVDDATAGGKTGLQWLVWSQCRHLLETDWNLQAAIGAGSIRGQSADPQEATSHLRSTPAEDILNRAARELAARPWAADVDLARAFRDFCREPDVTIDLAAAYVAGASLERSVAADHYRVPTHDAIAAELGVNDRTIRRYWKPTAELLALFPRESQLEIAEPFVESATFGTWQRLKAAEVTTLVLRVVLGAATAIRRQLADAAATWVHPLLRFDVAVPTPPPPGNDTAPVAQAEAAE